MKLIAVVALLLVTVQALPFPTFSKDDALTYTYYSYSAYCSKWTLSNWRCGYCQGNTNGFVTVDYSYDRTSDTAAFVGYHPDRQEIVVSFRGTVPTSIQNWVTDIVFCEVPANFQGLNATVHKGFQTAYAAHADLIVRKVKDLMNWFPNYNVVLTGHSLGGAMSTLLAMDLHYNHGIKTRIYPVTFGSPRVGNKAFADGFISAFQGRSWRITHKNDIVPHIPLTQMNFHHVANEVWFYNKNGDYMIGDATGEDNLLSEGNPINLSIVDHLTYMGVLFLVCF